MWVLLDAAIVRPPSADVIEELFTEFGRVVVRRMFGGAGIFADGLMFGLVSNEVIYLKVDEHNQPAFEREGMAPFAYGKATRRVLTSYWRMPERLYDAPDELARWAAESLAAARRNTAKSRRRKGSSVAPSGSR
jgi:DNA transformation protein and related proteins